LYLEIFTCLDIHLESSHTKFVPSNLHTGSGKVQVNLTNGRVNNKVTSKSFCRTKGLLIEVGLLKLSSLVPSLV
jgi:hypothetical protein